MAVQFEDILVCQCCLVWAANADDSGCDYYGCTHTRRDIGYVIAGAPAEDADEWEDMGECDWCIETDGRTLLYRAHVEVSD